MAELLLVANSGGHLQQLTLLEPRLPAACEPVWVVPETAQARSLLADRDVVWAPDVGARDVVGIARNLWWAWRHLRALRPRMVISTGAALAIGWLPLAACLGIEAHYIESATRTDGPSLTGRILRRVPGVRTHTQHERWAGDGWNHAGSVFDGFEVETVARRPLPSAPRVVVTVGTSTSWPFERLFDRLVEVLPADARVLWQSGCTPVAALGIDGVEQLPASELHDAMVDADVVIAHAGTGIALAAFLAGKVPVLVPRRAHHGEHVDDHQLQTAALLKARGLAISREVDELTAEDFALAASLSVSRTCDAADLQPLSIGVADHGS